MQERGGASYRIDTIFLGGGTPSLLTAAQMADLMEAVYAAFDVAEDAEISMECNPGTAGYEDLLGFRQAGINRLSIGVQSFSNEELRTIGRIHTRQQAIDCYNSARRAGFTNVSLDLMSALPGQTMETWQQSLETALSLGPDHLSCYSLILEDNTPLLARYEAGLLPDLPDEEMDRAMVHDTGAILAAAGYTQYEISNYARAGRECRHNIGYWTGHEYLGLGLGSSSMMRIDGAWSRFSNRTDPARYEACCTDLDALHQDLSVLTIEDRMEEYMFLGLRMNQGVSESAFHARFGKELEEIYPGVTDRFIDAALLVRRDGRIALTERGRDLANTVMSAYILTA